MSESYIAVDGKVIALVGAPGKGQYTTFSAAESRKLATKLRASADAVTLAADAADAQRGRMMEQIRAKARAAADHERTQEEIRDEAFWSGLL